MMNLYQVLEMGSITFLSPGTEDYVDLSKTILVVRAKVTKVNAENFDADVKIGPVNNFLHSLFKQVDVFLKGNQVTQATGTYTYRSYLETVLNYGPPAKQSHFFIGVCLIYFMPKINKINHLQTDNKEMTTKDR